VGNRYRNVSYSNPRYAVRWPRKNSFAAIIVGSAVLLFLVDVYCRGPITRNMSVNGLSIPLVVILSLSSVYFLGVGVLCSIRRPLLLEAGPDGIRIFVRKQKKEYNTELNDNDCRERDFYDIPWTDVSAIAKGIIYWNGFYDGGLVPEKSSALLIACGSLQKVSNYKYGNGDILVAYGADAKGCEIITNWPDSRIMGHEHESHIALNANYLPTSLDEAVRQIKLLKKYYIEQC